MAKANVLDLLYSKHRTPLEFNFDNLIGPPVLSLLTQQDVFELNRIARSVKLSGKIEEKYRLIDAIMTNRGFVKLHAGTNRVVYRYLEDQSFVVKVAVDKVGLGDNPAEFRNQFLLKPFVTKVFDVSSCGTVAVVERVDAIMSREEFASVADDIFNLLTKVFIGKYILEDVGAWFFMNWGIRKNGFGPVLLDFPYVYELDGNKLYCNAHLPGRPDIRCNGELDYDDGFNNLICTKCSRHYHARDLKKAEKDQLIIVGGKKKMKVKVMRGNEVISDSSKKQVAKVIEPKVDEKPRMEVKVNVPRDSIFNKIGEEVDNFATHVDEVTKDTRVAAPVYFEASEIRDAISGAMSEEDKETLDTIGEIIDHVLDNPDLIPDEYKSENEDVNEIKSEEVNEMVKEDDNEFEEIEEDIDDFDEDEDEDAEDYDQYLSNRDRKQNRQMEKQSRRTDYDGF